MSLFRSPVGNIIYQAARAEPGVLERQPIQAFLEVPIHLTRHHLSPATPFGRGQTVPETARCCCLWTSSFLHFRLGIPCSPDMPPRPRIREPERNGNNSGVRTGRPRCIRADSPGPHACRASARVPAAREGAIHSPGPRALVHLHGRAPSVSRGAREAWRVREPGPPLRHAIKSRVP